MLRLAWVINAQKAGTVFFVGALMWLWGNFSPAAWVYLGLHGSYGIIWLIKDVAMPDPRWQARSTLGGGLMAFVLVLGPYWFAPVILITDVLDHLGMERPPEPSCAGYCGLPAEFTPWGCSCDPFTCVADCCPDAGICF